MEYLLCCNSMGYWNIIGQNIVIGLELMELSFLEEKNSNNRTLMDHLAQSLYFIDNKTGSQRDINNTER